MRIVYLFIFLCSVNLNAKTVMTFNTMCDVCKGSSYLNFDQRVQHLQAVIRKYNPELISLQEVRTVSQLKDILRPFPQYKFIASDYGLISYADPAIVYNSNLFGVIKKGQFWLGPEDDFNFGWGFAIPRQVHWARMMDLKTKKRFVFISSHFDNRRKNLNGAAYKVNKFFSTMEGPLIFAADTNITPDAKYYPKLVNNLFDNSFDLKKSFKVNGKYETDKDLCYLRKGKSFPKCRVDHILLDQRFSWKVNEFIIDVEKFDGKFPSDHRAVIVDFEQIEP